MHCVLHIGTEKTGTSSLQKFLHINRSVLAEGGYLYTRSTGLRNNRSLPVAAYNKDRRDDFTQAHGIYNDKDLAAFQAKIINDLKTELKRAGDIHTVIFSSEHIQSRLRTDDELVRLRNILVELGFEQIKIVVYLRAPEEIASSLYSTAVKAGSVWLYPPGPDNEYWSNICDHRSTLTRFGEIFGSQALVPRIFSTSDLVNGSIIDDFADVIQLPLTGGEYSIPKSQNESLTFIGLEVLRRINREIPVFLDNQEPNILRGNIVSYVIKYLNEGDVYKVPPEIRRQYEEAFRESNEWVRAEHFPDRENLFEDDQTLSSCEHSFNDAELDQIANMIAAIWKDKTHYKMELYNSKAFKIIKPIWQQKKRLAQLAETLTDRWKTTSGE